MSAAEFLSVQPLLRISPERIEAARLCLVEGATMAAAGQKFGWSRQSVAEAVDVVWKALENFNAAQSAAQSASSHLPPGWEQVTLVAPHELVQKFRFEIAAAAARDGVAIEGKPRRAARSKARDKMGQGEAQSPEKSPA